MPDFDPTTALKASLRQAQDVRRFRDNPTLPVAAAHKQESVAAAARRKLDTLSAAIDQEERALPSFVTGFGSAANSLVEGAGTVTGLVTGDMDNAGVQRGRSGAEYFDRRKSQEQLVAEAKRTRAVDAADGVFGEFGAAFAETIKDPTLLGAVAGQAVPTLIPGGVAGRAAGLAAIKAASVSAKVATKIGTGVAVTVGAGQHGADQAGQVYTRVLEQPDEVWEQDPEYLAQREKVGSEQAKEDIALDLSRSTAAITGGISLATNLLPGGTTIEKLLAGGTKTARGLLKGMVRGAVGEGLQEVIEEGTGAAVSNAAVQQVDPDQDIGEGVGEGAALGLIGGGLLGGLAGAGRGGREATINRIRESEPAEGGPLKPAVAPEQRAAVAEESLASGDVSAMTQPGTAEYAPLDAAEVLQRRVTDQTLELSDDEREASRQQLSALALDLEAELKAANSNVKITSPETKSLIQERIALNEAALESNEPGSDEYVAAETKLAALNDALKLNESATPEDRTSRVKYQKDLQLAYNGVKDLQREIQGGQERQVLAETSDLIKQVESEEATPERDAAAQNLILKMATTPDIYGPDLLDPLVELPAFTADQKKALRAISAGHVARNALKGKKGVNQEVLTGGDGFKGLDAYALDMGEALRSNDQPRIAEEMNKLGSFLADHTQKANKLRAATAQTEADQQERYVVKTENVDGTTSWEILDQVPDGMDLGTNGALTVRPGKKGINSAKSLYRSISEENKAIQATGTQLRAMQQTARTEAPVQETVQETAVPEDSTISDEEAYFGSSDETVVAPEPTDEQTTTEPVQATESAKDVSPGPTIAENEQIAAEANVDEEATVVDPVDEAAQNLEATEVEAAQTQSLGVNEVFSNPAKRRAGAIPQAELDVKDETGVINHLSAYFSPTKVGKTKASRNPLMEVPGFVSGLTSKDEEGNTDIDIAKVLPYLDQDSLDQSEVDTLKNLATFMESAGEGIFERLELAAADKPFMQLRNYGNFFRGYTDENVTAAIGAAAFTWMLEEAGNKGINYDADIARILGIDESDVGYTAREEYGTVGLPASWIRDTLGQRAVQMLGIRANKDAPRDAQSKLEQVMGAHALAALRAEGLVEQVTKMFAAPGEPKVVPRVHVRPVHEDGFVEDADSNALAFTMQMLEHGKGSKNIVNRLFSLEAGLVDPASDPSEMRPAKVRKGVTEPAPSIVAAREEASKRPWEIRGQMRKAWTSLSGGTMQAIAGVDFREDTSIHKANRLKRTTKNDSTLRELQRVADFDGRHGENPFYMIPTIQIHGRSGYESNVVDPQQNTVQRFAVKMANWETTVPSDPNNEIRQGWELAVAQGMGIAVDKKYGANARAELQTKMQSKVMQDGVAAAKKFLNDETLEVADEAALVAAVREGGEDMHSFDSLLQWATMEQADGKDFTTDMMFETDGINNGPALAHFFMGAMNSFKAMSTGFYTGSRIKSFLDYKENGGLDMYEQAMVDTMESIARTPDVKYDIINAIQHLAGDKNGLFIDAKKGTVTKEGRKFIKQPLTSLVFGKSVKGAIADLGGALEELYYARLEKDLAEAGGDFNAATPAIRQTVAAVNTLLWGEGQIRGIRTARDAFEVNINRTGQGQLAGRFIKHMGPHLEAVIYSQYSDFMAARDNVNEMAQAISQLYMAAYEHEYAKTLNAKMDSGEIRGALVAFKENNPRHKLFKRIGDKVRLPEQDLSTEEVALIEEKLKPLMPVVHSALSVNGGSPEQGLFLPRISKEFAAENEPMYNQEVKIGGDGVPATYPGRNEKLEKSTRTYGHTRELVDPGVRAMILMVHSSDSAIASRVWAKLGVLNVHDALGAGIADVNEVAEALNSATYAVLTEYSIPMEMYDALSRSMTAARLLSEADPELRKALSNVTIGNDDNVQRVDKDFDRQHMRASMRAEIQKLRQLVELNTVSQYASENHYYTVTEEARAAVQEKLDSLTAEAESLGVNLTFEETVSPVENTPAQTPNGDLYTPSVTPDKGLEALLREYDGKPAKDFLRKLRRIIRSERTSNRVQDYQEALWAQLGKLLDENVTIHLLTPESQVRQEIKDAAQGARGLFDIGNNKIYIKSSAFGESVLNSEVILHEITHGVLARQITALESYTQVPKTRVPKDMKDAYAALQDLKGLMQKAKETVEGSDTLREQFGAAVGDIQEFVAWGMTSSGFQEQVLASIETDNLAGERASRSGLRGFIRNIARILFGDRVSEAATNGLGQMLANTGVLLDSVQQRKLKARPSTILQMATGPDPDGFNTQQTFTALGRLGQPGQASTERLSTILDKVVNTVYGPFGVQEQWAARRTATTAEEVYLRALQSGKAPYASLASHKLPLSNQEGFVLASLEVTLREALRSSQFGRQQADRIWTAAKEQFKKPEDMVDNWNTLSSNERDAITDAHQFLFHTKSKDYMSQFMAAALVYEPLHQALGRMKVPSIKRKTESFADKLMAAFGFLMDQLSSRVTRVFTGQKANDAIGNLAIEVAQIKANEQQRLNTVFNKMNDGIEHLNSKMSDAVKSAVKKTAGSSAATGSKNLYVRTSAKLLNAIASDRVDAMMEVIQKSANGMSQGLMGFMGELMNELRGENSSNTISYKLLSQTNKLEQDVKGVKQNVARFIRESFRKEPTKSELEALTNVVLNTDLGAALEAFDMEQISEFINNPQALETAIQGLEDQLSGDNKNYYLGVSKDLAHFMTTGVNTKGLPLNAGNIAQMLHTSKQGTVAPADVERIGKILDPLISLYALREADSIDLDIVRNTLAHENNRPDDGNGIEFLMKLHRESMAEAKREVFNDSSLQMIKGYTKPIHNPNVATELANDRDAELYKKAGYVALDENGLPQDSFDTTRETMHMMVLRGNGLNKTVNGALPFTSRQSKGSKIVEGIRDPVSGVLFMKNAKTIREIAAKTRKVADSYFTRSAKYDPRLSRPKSGNLLPVIDNNGQVSNYRYTIEKKTEREVLDPDYRADQLVANTMASTLNKKRSPELAKKVIEEMKTEYNNNFAKRPADFVEVSANSADPDIQERYKLLPVDTKIMIKEVWGQNKMYVRKDLYNITFGYRKASVESLFTEAKENQNFVKQMFVTLLGQVPIADAEGNVTYIPSKKAQRLIQTERGWQEIVTMVKDIYVIKNLFTLLGNEFSNFTLLAWAGVPLQDIVKNKIKATQATVGYLHQQRERSKLEHQVNSGYIEGVAKKQAEERIVELTAQMDLSPVKELIDAGLFQTLVEDLGQDPDPYSYKSQLSEWIDGKTEWVPDGIKSAARVGLMTHDTTLYQLLNKATMFSDFTSRYTLHQHLTKRSVNPLSHEDSLQFVRRAFVNYDVPTHKGVQYLNDMGILWFSKYYLRIQNVIFQLMKERPANALGMLMFSNFFDGAQSILDSGIWNKWQGNWGTGPLEYPGALKELITVQAASAPFD